MFWWDTVVSSPWPAQLGWFLLGLGLNARCAACMLKAPALAAHSPNCIITIIILGYISLCSVPKYASYTHIDIENIQKLIEVIN